MHSYPNRVNPSTTVTCTAPGCRHTPTGPTALAEALDLVTARPAVEGTDLCQWHHKQLPILLADLARLWPDLETGLYRKASGELNERVQSSGIVDISQSWNPDVSEIMTAIEEWTAFLVRKVLSDYALPEDASEVSTLKVIVHGEDGTSLETRTETKTTVHAHALAGVSGTRLALSVLARHYASWLSSYPRLGPSVLADAYEHRYAAIQALKTMPVRRVRLANATCGQVITDPDLGAVSCMGIMVAVFQNPDEQRPSVMMCSVHPKTHPRYSKAEWMTWGANA
jgi:hypothetical protein